MSCNHLDDCPRCGDTVDALEHRAKGLVTALVECKNYFVARRVTCAGRSSWRDRIEASIDKALTEDAATLICVRCGCDTKVTAVSMCLPCWRVVRG